MNKFFNALILLTMLFIMIIFGYIFFTSKLFYMKMASVLGIFIALTGVYYFTKLWYN